MGPRLWRGDSSPVITTFFRRYYTMGIMVFLALKLWILIMYIFYKVKRLNAFTQAYLQTLTQDFTFTIKE